ncbi:phage/plasmid replication domain-containing protein [Anaerotignum propionicum]|uniref:Replication-associated protein G2P N-terminal domain-containing protein n=1 Tax=Anaerotignum propionicum DSM 1682 TaxID=991789 RepID=A0A0X8V9C6_ANAPI|nr:phage/plasmid replication protein [Anaerotignum propionicum]AMJ39768.1 hypothetical protein CPRO_01440 [Anaerotignum propionicum DSM 1682]SHE28823.1 hypothetical protein SAMN02745151_00209 [[Clostridium] propionicum DSM 1682] [Anaerotignum propionicum DSM 1682]
MVHTLQLKYTLAPQDIIYIEKREEEFKHTDILFKETGLKATIYFRRQYPYETVDHENWYIIIHINLQELLNKGTATNADLEVIYNKLSDFANNFSLADNPRLILQRIDFKRDLIIPDNTIRQAYIDLIKKSYQKWGYFTKSTFYKTSVEFANKSRKIIIYDKNKELHDKHRSPKTYEQDVLRIEVQLKRRYISNHKCNTGLADVLDNYLSEEMNKAYFNHSVLPVIFNGSYRTKENSAKIIDLSTYRADKKKKLKEFLECIEQTSINDAKESYAVNTFARYIKALNNLDINPIQLRNEFITEQGIYIDTLPALLKYTCSGV